MPSATASTRAAEPSIPDFTAAGGRSSASASSWRVTSATGTGSQLLTPTVFCAVTAVTTLVPNTPNWWNVFRSAWSPAPPPESEPAIVRAIFTGAGLLTLLGLGWGRRGRQRAHRALQLVKQGRVLLAGPRGASRRVGGGRPRHVGDPVRRQLVVARGVLDQATRHIDVPAGDRERVHVGRVHDPEGPWEIAPRGDGDEGVDGGIEWPLDNRVMDHGHTLVHLGGVLVAELQLLLDADGAGGRPAEPERPRQEGQTPPPLLGILMTRGRARTCEGTHPQ